MIWKVENHEGTKIWYSSDVIEKIIEKCKKEKFDIYLAGEILKIIEDERSESGNCMV